MYYLPRLNTATGELQGWSAADGAWKPLAQADEASKLRHLVWKRLRIKDNTYDNKRAAWLDQVSFGALAPQKGLITQQEFAREFEPLMDEQAVAAQLSTDLAVYLCLSNAPVAAHAAAMRNTLQRVQSSAGSSSWWESGWQAVAFGKPRLEAEAAVRESAKQVAALAALQQLGSDKVLAAVNSAIHKANTRSEQAATENGSKVKIALQDADVQALDAACQELEQKLAAVLVKTGGPTGALAQLQEAGWKASSEHYATWHLQHKLVEMAEWEAAQRQAMWAVAAGAALITGLGLLAMMRHEPRED